MFTDKLIPFQLRRATIQDPVTGLLRSADYRVSKSAWLAPSDYEFVRQIALRAQDATNLDIRFAGSPIIADWRWFF